jgi:hypothetical protein
MDEERVARLVNGRVVHFYGSLGSLPYFSDRGVRTYAADLTPENIKTAAEQIHVLHEASLSREFINAAQLMDEADRICFLGFGYHPDSMRHLFHRPLKAKNVYGSAFGIMQVEADAIKEGIKSRIVTDGTVTLGSEILDCLTFLRNFRVLV